MPVVNGYCTLQELRDEQNIQLPNADTRIERVITTVSRLIDNYCDRHFFQTDENTQRFFTPIGILRLLIDDVVTITEVVADTTGDATFDKTITAYDAEPRDAPGSDEPFTALQIRRTSGDFFPAGIPSGVRVTGTWGWPAVPPQVTEACLIQTSMIFKAAEIPLGQVNIEDVDARIVRLPSRLHPTVRVLLEDLRRDPILVA